MKYLTTMFLALLLAVPAMADYSDYSYNIDVVDQRSLSTGDAGKLTTGVLAFVYDAGTKDLSTLYSNVARASLSNPITRAQFATDDALKFYSASASHDIVLAHSDGSMAKYASVSQSMHRLVLNRDGLDKVVVVAFGVSSAAETDTGVDLPYGSHVTDVLVEVVTADSGQTLDVGLLSTETSGDANGFIAAITMTNTGFVKPQIVTEGSSESYVSTTSLGALMGNQAVGTDANEDTGQSLVTGHIVTGANAQSITYTGDSGTDTAVGYIYVFFRHLR